ncbi:rab11 family-interacting protein 4A [Phymastichus coffea]|uniref:rab11 family-interacting protein 4A n=1 Tax=Phymastichus coffea TaxID=108790 RepID=UPI00273CC953|nr:rab11 family-interacting protein 4A [Phymastichus coffea]
MVSSRTPGLRSSAAAGVEGLMQQNHSSSVLAAGGPRQPSSSTWSQSEPTLLTTNSNNSTATSVRAESPSISAPAVLVGPQTLGEEQYEAFGVVDDPEDSPSQGSGSPAASPIAGVNPNRNPRSPNSMLLNRNTWLRTSLGRSPAGASRKRLSSNALASQLYRSSSFNSSGRGSICDTADDVYSDVSLEEDVIDLNHRVQMIQEQMHALADTQSAGEERYARVKQDNATLQARILMLEEAAKDAEARAEERLETEQRRHREWASRLEREKELQLENCAIKLQAAEAETARTKDEAKHLREQLEKLRAEKTNLELALEEAQHEVELAKEAERRAAQSFSEANRSLMRAEEELAQRIDAEKRFEEITEELANLRVRNKALEESRDELQAAAAALQAGRELLMPSGQDPNDNTINRKNSPSLATELLLTGSTHDETDSDTGKPDTADYCDNITTLAEAKQKLREKDEVNARLRAYIDGMLQTIVENHPELLEVKRPH